MPWIYPYWWNAILNKYLHFIKTPSHSSIIVVGGALCCPLLLTTTPSLSQLWCILLYALTTAARAIFYFPFTQGTREEDRWRVTVALGTMEEIEREIQEEGSWAFADALDHGSEWRPANIHESRVCTKRYTSTLSLTGSSQWVIIIMIQTKPHSSLNWICLSLAKNEGKGRKHRFVVIIITASH